MTYCHLVTLSFWAESTELDDLPTFLFVWDHAVRWNQYCPKGVKSGNNNCMCTLTLNHMWKYKMYSNWTTRDKKQIFLNMIISC